LLGSMCGGSALIPPPRVSSSRMPREEAPNACVKLWGGPERQRLPGMVRTGRSQARNVQKDGARGDRNSGRASCGGDCPGTPSRRGRPSMASHGELGPWLSGSSIGWGENSWKIRGYSSNIAVFGRGRLVLSVDLTDLEKIVLCHGRTTKKASDGGERWAKVEKESDVGQRAQVFFSPLDSIIRTWACWGLKKVIVSVFYFYNCICLNNNIYT
jgi:hypothetical protein